MAEPYKNEGIEIPTVLLGVFDVVPHPLSFARGIEAGPGAPFLALPGGSTPALRRNTSSGILR